MTTGRGFGRWMLVPVALVALLSGLGARGSATPSAGGDADATGRIGSGDGGEALVVSDFERAGEFLNWFPSGETAIDATTRRHGDASLRLTTAGDGSPVAAETALSRPLDPSGGYFHVWTRVDDPSRLSELWLQVTGDGWASHVTYRLEERVTRAGAWHAVATASEPRHVVGDPDPSRIDRIRVRANDRGGRPVTVHVDRLELRPLPPTGVVSLTFDDGWANQARTAWPIMRRHGFPGTVFVIPYLVGVEGRLGEEDLRELQADGWDVGGHYHPSLEGREEPELSGIVRTAAAFTARWMGDAPRVFAYPQGYFGAGVAPAVAAEFDAARTVRSGFEALPPADPFRLRSLEVQSDTTLEEIDAALERAREDRLWFILSFHRVTPTVTAATELAPDRFAAILDRIAASGLPVRTMTEVLRTHPPSGP